MMPAFHEAIPSAIYLGYLLYQKYVSTEYEVSSVRNNRHLAKSPVRLNQRRPSSPHPSHLKGLFRYRSLGLLTDGYAFFIGRSRLDPAANYGHGEAPEPHGGKESHLGASSGSMLVQVAGEVHAEHLGETNVEDDAGTDSVRDTYDEASSDGIAIEGGEGADPNGNTNRGSEGEDGDKEGLEGRKDEDGVKEDEMSQHQAKMEKSL